MSIEILSIRQVKAARALLDWSQHDLARASGVSYPTIARLEKEDGNLGGRPATFLAIRQALEDAGVEFIEENGGGAGVRSTDKIIASYEDRNVVQRKRSGEKPLYWVSVLQEKDGIALPDISSQKTEDFREAQDWAIQGSWPKE